jgi:hypothetical protein
MFAIICGLLNKSSVNIVEIVLCHNEVPFGSKFGTQPNGIQSDKLRAGMKRAASQISWPEHEIYLFTTRYNLFQAATDEMLQLVVNICMIHLKLLCWETNA